MRRRSSAARRGRDSAGGHSEVFVRDPAGNLTDPRLNRFTYVQANPANLTDPSGRLSVDEILGGIFTVASVVQGFADGEVTWTELANFAIAEGSGVAADLACNFAIGYFSAGTLVAVAGTVCAIAGIAVSEIVGGALG